MDRINDDITFLIRQLDDPVIERRKNAQTALAEIGEPAVEPLLDLLENGNPTSRSSAAIVLGLIRDARAVEPLIKLVETDHLLTTLAAAQSLGDLGDCRAVEPLLAQLGCAQPLVQIQIIVSLGKLKDLRAVETLIALLKSTPFPSVRYNTIRALAALGEKRAVDHILAFADDDDAHVRTHVQRALQHLGVAPSPD